ncbi:MAG: anthranilate synthase component I family protein [Bacteroidaceae bacterium]|nr:anthranilate synthase component I family protein [Bacteroidaceae bacterium]
MTYRYQVLSRPLPGDLATPVGTYLKVRDLYAQSALMESSDYHSAENNQSFIALEPIASIRITHGTALFRLPGDRIETREISEDYDVPAAFCDFMNRFSVEGTHASYCGLYGFTSSNAVRYFEQINVKDSCEPERDAADICYILYRHLLVFNDYHNELMLLTLQGEGENPDTERIVQAVEGAAGAAYAFRAIGEPTSTLTDDEHRENIRRGINHCLRGDVFQIVLSRRYEQRFEGDDFQLYRALRRINPSPYLFYFDFGDMRIFGSSPETHLRVAGSEAFIDPIAGTMRRDGRPEEDSRIAETLRNDPKENAEHTMLVDLARNDLSRHCDNVGVVFLKETQRYSHVIHLVSRVGGRVRPNTNPMRLLADTFPAGTLSGAPKVRALQLIAEYEPHNRGAYGGCIGFIGLDGTLNQAITIRTFVSRSGTLWYQAGGGIVAKSKVEDELQEVHNKLGALRSAIDIAEEIR